MNKEIDLTNKVVLDLNDYIKLTNQINDLEHKVEFSETKYQNIINYLFSECEVKKYISGNRYLIYDTYKSHLAEYLKEIEPEKYNEKLETYEECND